MSNYYGLRCKQCGARLWPYRADEITGYEPSCPSCFAGIPQPERAYLQFASNVLQTTPPEVKVASFEDWKKHRALGQEMPCVEYPEPDDADYCESAADHDELDIEEGK